MHSFFFSYFFFTSFFFFHPQRFSCCIHRCSFLNINFLSKSIAVIDSTHNSDPSWQFNTSSYFKGRISHLTACVLLAHVNWAILPILSWVLQDMWRQRGLFFFYFLSCLFLRIFFLTRTWQVILHYILELTKKIFFPISRI